MGKGTRATAGHMPLTHHERTKKFTIHSTSDSADYGTTSLRLAGHSQYQIGTCALTTQSLQPSLSGGISAAGSSSTTSSALCSPSGYIYDETSVLEYLLLQTQQIKQRQQHQEQMKNQETHDQLINESNAKKRQIEQFDESQRIIKKSTQPTQSEQEKAIDDLHRVSYWLSTAQPVAKATMSTALPTASTSQNNRYSATVTLALTNGDVIGNTTQQDKIPTDVVVTTEPTSNAVMSPTPTASNTPIKIPERPGSPMTGQPLLRRDLWPIQLEWTSADGTSQVTAGIPKVKCAISDRIISTGAPVIAYWTTKKPYQNTDHHHLGVVVLQSVFEQELKLHLTNQINRCPITDRTIRHVRTLQRSGSSYAASGQNVMSAKHYKPTIT